MGWVGDEPAGHEWVLETLRLVRRAGRRPLLTFALALLAGAVLFGLELRRPPIFSARAELILRESALSRDRTVFSRADLRSFVEDVAFTSSALQDVMDRHALFRAEAARSLVLAQSEMRKSIQVDILQDYLAEDRQESAPSRSARIVITFAGDDPDQAMAVVRDLGLLVARAELGRHAERARQQAASANAAAAEARAAANRTQGELAAMEAAAAQSPAKISSAQRMKIAFSRAWLAKLEGRRSQLEREHVRLDLTAAAEEKQAGTRVHLASLQAENARPHSELGWLRNKAAIAGAAGLTLALLLVGAFDPRLYNADDVRRAGSLSLGSLRAPHKRQPTKG
jgi:hypothetical protein